MRAILVALAMLAASDRHLSNFLEVLAGDVDGSNHQNDAQQCSAVRFCSTICGFVTQDSNICCKSSLKFKNQSCSNTACCEVGQNYPIDKTIGLDAYNTNYSKSTTTRSNTSSLRILQIIIKGITTAKSEYLHRLLLELDIDVVNIQDTNTEDDFDMEEKGRFPGYVLLKGLHHPKYGAASYVKSNLDAYLTGYSDENLIFTIVMKVGELTVTNIYKPLDNKWSYLSIQPHPSIYTGVFNHSYWCSGNCDDNGKDLAHWADVNDLHQVYDKAESYHHSDTLNYNSNLAFVSKNNLKQPLPCNRTFLHTFPDSQYRPILFDVGLNMPLINLPLGRWNFQEANWKNFADQLEVELNTLGLKPIPSNYRNFTGFVLKSATSNIPFIKEYPKWNSKSEQLYQTYINSGDQNTGRQLLQSLDTARENQRESAVVAIDKRSSLRDQEKKARSVTADDIADRLVELSRVKGDKLFTENIEKKLKILKDNAPKNQHISRPFEIGEIMLVIKNLKINNTPSHDHINNQFIMHMGPLAVNWLTELFNHILQYNILPKEFKLARVYPKLKLRKKETLENYRPISKLNSIFKLLERVILNRISPIIETVTQPEQFAHRLRREDTQFDINNKTTYIIKRNTVALLALTDFIETGYQNGLNSLIVFTDFTSVLNTLWKQGLMYKVRTVIPSKELADLIENILTDQELEVYLRNSKSKRVIVNGGMPQGCVLGPKLLNLYVNDLPDTEAKKFIYADDMALVVQSKSLSVGEKTLTNDLEKFAEYCKFWRLIPKKSKVKVSYFYPGSEIADQPSVFFNGEKLEVHQNHTFLGFVLDRHLTYKKHLT